MMVPPMEASELPIPSRAVQLEKKCFHPRWIQGSPAKMAAKEGMVIELDQLNLQALAKTGYLSLPNSEIASALVVGNDLCCFAYVQTFYVSITGTSTNS